MHNVLTCPVLPTLTQAANHHTLADHLTPWARLAGGDRMDQSASTRSSTQIAINRRANMGSEVAPMQIDRVRNTSTTSTATATAITTTSSTTETTSPTITARTPVRPTTVRPALNTTMAAEQYRDDDGGGGTGPPPPKVCFNSKCLTTDSPSWKPSWMLRSGRIADLCETCGSAYERLCFCETFHWNDSGWRACISCQQWVHCGCIASASAYILVDGGGVQCMNCTSNKFSNPKREASRIEEQITDVGGWNQESPSVLPFPSLRQGQGGLKIWQGRTEVQPQIAAASTASVTMPVALGSKNEKVNEVHEQKTSRSVFMQGRLSTEMAGCSEQNLKVLSPTVLEAPASFHRIKATMDLPQAPVCVAHPSPGEGKGKNLFLPRYWPRFSEQELQKITCGDSNSTITPLFEKILSASDASRIGRLVLPKACAEAYFPAISQPEGVLIRIQDITGKEWLFQFRFWPNNNSRMYVLEGVTPCIRSLRLVAGDTVTFSRLDPEGKLIMGYRRAPNSLSSQDVQTTDALLPSVTSAAMESTIEIAELCSRPMVYAGGCPMDAHMSLFSSSSIFEAGDGQSDAEKKNLKIKGIPHYASVILDKKTNKNWLLDVEGPIDESKFTWQDLQELLQPPPNVRPSVVTIEGHDFEEYEVPPVFGKRTIYMSRQGRASCTAPQDLKNEEVNRLFPGKEVRKEETQEVEIEAPANLEEDLQQLSPPVATTKHPRHRPGCSCIVCTQAPSGKGPKHKPSCICNMCVIVSRRFQTKMSKCRKGQSEEGQKGNDMKKHIGRTGGKEVVSWANPHRETQSVHEDRHGKETLFEALDRASPTFMSNLSSRVNRPSLSEGYPSKPRSSAEENMLEETLFDLNSQPEQDDESFKVTGGETMTMLLQNANHTLERYLQQQGISSLSCLSKTVEDFHCK